MSTGILPPSRHQPHPHTWNQDPALSGGRTAGSLAALEGDRLASVPEHVWRGHTQETRGEAEPWLLWAHGPVWGGQERGPPAGLPSAFWGCDIPNSQGGAWGRLGGRLRPRTPVPSLTRLKGASSARQGSLVSSLPTPCPYVKARADPPQSHAVGAWGLGGVTPPALHTVAGRCEVAGVSRPLRAPEHITPLSVFCPACSESQPACPRPRFPHL